MVLTPENESSSLRNIVRRSNLVVMLVVSAWLLRAWASRRVSNTTYAAKVPRANRCMMTK
jgi:hypothetical protein